MPPSPTVAPEPAVHPMLKPAPPSPPTADAERPEQLRAAATLAGVFPVPEGSRFVRRAGRLAQYRLTAPLEQVTRFYRKAGFTVLDKPHGAAVYPVTRTREQEFLLVQKRAGEVLHLVVYQGPAGP